MMQNMSQKSSGDKNKEVGGTKFKFGQLILRKLIKILATGCHINFKAKTHQFNFGLGCTPDSAGGVHSTPPDSLAGFKGSYF